MKPEEVQTRSDLARFIRELLDEFEEKPSWWENVEVDTYLDALSRWTADMEGYFHNQGQSEPPQPTWSLVARMLSAATMYE